MHVLLKSWLLSVVLLVAAGGAGFCITDEVMWEQFEFNFATPGARANAMGRAFVALADDATAAHSNPAGLVLLTKPEVSFENKTSWFVSERPAAADSLETGQTMDFGESINSPAFASFVYPKQNLRLALFRQEFLNYEEEYRLEKRAVPGTPLNLFQVDGDMKMKGVHWGLATAYRFSNSVFAGFSARISQLRIEALQERELRNGPHTRIDTNSSEFTFAAGVIFNFSRKISAGAVYERNGKYEFEESYQKKYGDFAPPYPVVLKVPDRFAVGMALRPTEGLTVIVDVVRVEYSSLAEDFTIIFNDESQPEDFVIRDATEFHIGAEHIFFVKSTGVAVRGGIFTNPAHRLRYQGDELQARITFNFGQAREKTDVALTIGGGVSVSNQTQIDAAYIFSDTFDEFSLSFVLRF